MDGRDSHLAQRADQAFQSLGLGSGTDDFSPFGQVSRYSVRKEFDGATVFVTGATGFIGSLVVELLLRTTDVGRIYVLARGKRGASARERVQRLLHSGLFHAVRDKPEVVSKVVIMEGDMTQDDLGLSHDDQITLENDVQFVIHAASIIELEADVQRTLRSNYLGTKRLLLLAGRMARLRAVVHLSAAHANVNLPPGSSVDEGIYPLYFGNQEVDHASLVDDLMSLCPESANVRAQMYLDMWNFPNTYTLGKNLTEKLVAHFHSGGLPVAIVRPSMVCGLAGAPYPGYSGSLAGPGGQALAQAIGLYDSLDSFAMVPTNVWDVIPADMVAATVVAAAAATSARIHIDGYGLDGAAGADAHSRICGPSHAPDGGLGGAAGLGGAGGAGPLIVHAATSTTYPISYVESQWAALSYIALNPPPFRLPGADLFKVPLDFRPDPAKVDRSKRNTAWKVWFAIKVLEALGQHKTARRLRWGHIAWDVQNDAKTDRNLFFTTKNLLALEAQLDPSEAPDYVMVWTLRRGGWPRYIATTLAGMYRQVFGITRVEGPIDHDFSFIPSKEPPLLRRRRRKGAAKPAAANGGTPSAFEAGAAAAPADAAAGSAAGSAAAAAEGAAAEGGQEGAQSGATELHPQLSSVQEEESEDYSAEAFDPMAATHQAVLAACATVPASGATALAGARGQEGEGGGDEERGAGQPGGGGKAARDEAELMAAAAPHAVQDARGMLRVAAVALGRSMSYRPSIQLSSNFDLSGLGGASFSTQRRENSAMLGGQNSAGLQPSAGSASLGGPGGPGGLGAGPTGGGLTKSVSMRPSQHRGLGAAPSVGGGPMKPSWSVVTPRQTLVPQQGR